MAVTFDPTTDFEDVCDGLEAVTLNHRNGTTETAVTKAMQRSVVDAEGGGSPQDTFGKVVMADAVWHLPVAEMATRPELGATITDSESSVWEILSVAEQALSRRWRCASRQITVTSELTTVLSIERATFSKGRHGETVPSWSVWRTVDGHIQQISVDPSVQKDAKLNISTHLILLAADLELGSQHRIVSSDGTIYNISRVISRKSLGKLMTVEAIQSPFPFAV